MRRALSGPVEGAVERLVRLAQDHLGMDVVYVAEFSGGKQVYRALAGDAESFGLKAGDGHALDGSYCALMTEGQIPNVIPDSAADARVRHLPSTSQLRIGAYVGVPLYLPDGELYGTFCGLSHGAEADLNPRDAKFMSMLGEFVADQLAEGRRLSEQRGAIREVLETQNMQMALQPVVDLTTGRCVSMEALARFPTGLGSPDVVFAQAEEVGLRVELETLAVAKAIELLPALAPDQSLAVNLSPDIALLLMARTEHDRPLHQLTLEITEHAAVENYAEIREQIAPLRERGLRLAIDDAGAGFASLRHIIELRPDIIKIDRALIAGIDRDAGRRSALTTFVLLALDIGGSVVAEGVETRAELATVASLGVDAAQGYLLARPSTDPAEIERWSCSTTLLSEALARTNHSVAAGGA